MVQYQVLLQYLTQQIIQIPRWRTGTRVFRLSSSTDDRSSDVETSGEVDYTAEVF